MPKPRSAYLDIVLVSDADGDITSPVLVPLDRIHLAVHRRGDRPGTQIKFRSGVTADFTNPLSEVSRLITGPSV